MKKKRFLLAVLCIIFCVISTSCKKNMEENMSSAGVSEENNVESADKCSDQIILIEEKKNQTTEKQQEISSENTTAEEKTTEEVEVKKNVTSSRKDNATTAKIDSTENTSAKEEGHKKDNTLVTEETTETVEETPAAPYEWIETLKVSQQTNQLILVAAHGNNATVTMCDKDENGKWMEFLKTEAVIGKNGIGKTEEGDKKTPTGRYKFSFGFGTQENPGTALSYTQVDDTYYWVDDVNSQYYNQFVSTKDVEQDWTSAEHIMSASVAYRYALAINYNSACTPGVGSAIFMHCKNSNSTSGCIAVSEKAMVKILRHVNSDCILLIDQEDNLKSY